MIATIRSRFCSLAMLLGAVFTMSSWAIGQSLVSYEVATPAGLDRSWFGQVQLDVTRHRVENWLLYEDNLLALTTAGTVHSFNAETGETLWVSQIGPLDQAALGPSANDKYLSLLSGAVLYVVNRANGEVLWSRPVGSAPAAAPALSNDYAYVSMMSGRIEGYRLDDRKRTPWYSQSIGRIFHSPTTSGQVVSWPTDRGYLYVGKAEQPRVLYRIETSSPATAPPTESDPYLYVVTADGHLYCFEETNGREIWRYSMGYTSPGRAAVVGDRVYVASSEPMLHALDAKTGELLWTVPGITQFVSQGKKHVYGLDDLGRLLIVDFETGRYVDTLAGANYRAVFNDQSDRVYLVNRRGLVQCLREINAVEPTMYRKLPAEEKPEESAAPPAEVAPPTATQPEEPTVPFGEESAPSATPFEDEGGEEAENPFDFE